MQRLTVLALLLVLGCRNPQQPKPTAAAATLEGFQKVDSLNPILVPTPSMEFIEPVGGRRVHWEEKNVLNPAAVVKDGKVYLLYRAQDSNMVSRIGMAVSTDGLHFTRMPEPVLFPDQDSLLQYESKGGVEDPRVVQMENGTYLLTYTSYDGKTARLCLASSTDLMHWQKHGPVLQGPKYHDRWSKSGAIVVKQNGDKMLATKINGRYWMYFGDTHLFMASSADGFHWQPLEQEENGALLAVLSPRPGRFDSRLVEPGPFALLRDSSILLIYNSSNAANFNDPGLPKFTYSAGQALFSAKLTYLLEYRTSRPFIKPDQPYEKQGEVNEVCFVEGLVHFNGCWFLYYGTADSKIAVAVKTD